MAEAATAIEVAGATGVFKYGSQLVTQGLGKVLNSWDRARGLSILKKLPTGLEAMVFGEDDVTPELLAALTLGGKPGIQLSVIAFLKSDYIRYFLFRFMRTDDGYESKPLYDGETFLTRFFETCSNDDPSSSQMNRKVNSFFLFNGKKGRVDLDHDHRTISLQRKAHVRVVGFVHEVIKRQVFGPLIQVDGRVYYCENLGGGKLNGCEVDLDTPDSRSQHDFIVSPGVLESYSDFRRLMYLLSFRDLTLKLLGLAKVGKELGEEFASQITGGGIPLLSVQHLQNVRNNPMRCSPTLKMPTKEEVQARVEEAMERMTLRDRDVEVVLFGSMQEIISDFVINVESEAGRRRNVGVQPYKREKGSKLIHSCIVQAVGMDATFAIFAGFRKHRLNIAVSPGSTAIYFPALALTAVFPEGFEVQHRKTVLRPACPFSSDLEESLPILLGVAPKLAKHHCREFAKAISLELAKDPALALSPVTFGVASALSPRGRAHDAEYLTDLFGHLKQWGESSVAGVLCQLGVTFSVPPRREGHEVEDFRCFFQVCREIWPSTCLGAELVVDCSVDISGCKLKVNADDGLFLVPANSIYKPNAEDVMKEVLQYERCYRLLVNPRVSNLCYKLTGEVADVWANRWNKFEVDEAGELVLPMDDSMDLRECVGFLEGPVQCWMTKDSDTSAILSSALKCRVIGSKRQPREEESKTE